MATGRIEHQNQISIITTATPTQAQLQSAQIVIVWLAAKNSASRCTIIDTLGTGEGMVSNQDYAGTYQLAYIQWNKALGTLTCDANDTIVRVTMIF